MIPKMHAQPKQAQPKKIERKRRWPLVLFILIVLMLLGWFTPLPKIKAQPSYNFRSKPSAANLAWPGYGQSAVGAVGYGILDTHGSQTPAPIASVTKAITAMAVLQKKPLSVGEQGPTITITSQDVATYKDYYANDGSVVAVTEGEQLSEYQALQAMLLPSANNMADTLTRWAFGSTNTYLAYANQYVQHLGMKQTNVADASGFSAKSVSTAQDMTIIGMEAMKNPVLAEIVSQSSAELPVAGTIHSTNFLLGSGGIVGIKTGNTDQAGGCYLVAAKRVIAGQPVTEVATIIGAPDLITALSDSRPLLASVDKGFNYVTVVKRGQTVATYVSQWGDLADVKAKDNLGLLNWSTRQVYTTLNIDGNETTVSAGQQAGTITAVAWDKKVSGKLITDSSLKDPGWQWRLYKRHI